MKAFLSGHVDAFYGTLRMASSYARQVLESLGKKPSYELLWGKINYDLAETETILCEKIIRSESYVSRSPKKPRSTESLSLRISTNPLYEKCSIRNPLFGKVKKID